jgi:hypothetical protein
MANILQREFPEVDTCPLYYISTHGFYDMEKYASGTPMVVTVPPNAIVIETSKIGEFCYFTNVLTILKRLLLDRPNFVEYLGGTSSEDPLAQKIILTVLSSCQFYLPGVIIPNRILEATGGIYKSEGRMESERTGDYGNMGFYKYTPGKQVEPIFTRRYSELISGAYGSVTGRGTAVNTSSIPFETSGTIFERIDTYKDSFKIIVFSSCGEIRDTNPPSASKIQEIRGIQEWSVRTWNERLKVNYNESRKALHAEFDQRVAETLGLASKNYVPRKLTNFSEKQVPQLGMTLRSANKKGGTRRFVKKSKRTRRILKRTLKYRVR